MIKIILQVEGEDKVYWIANPNETELEEVKAEITKIIDKY